jgi:hypothetical protein
MSGNQLQFHRINSPCCDGQAMQRDLESVAGQRVLAGAVALCALNSMPEGWGWERGGVGQNLLHIITLLDSGREAGGVEFPPLGRGSALCGLSDAPL